MRGDEHERPILRPTHSVNVVDERAACPACPDGAPGLAGKVHFEQHLRAHHHMLDAEAGFCAYEERRFLPSRAARFMAMRHTMRDKTSSIGITASTVAKAAPLRAHFEVHSKGGCRGAGHIHDIDECEFEGRCYDVLHGSLLLEDPDIDCGHFSSMGSNVLRFGLLATSTYIRRQLIPVFRGRRETDAVNPRRFRDCRTLSVATHVL